MNYLDYMAQQAKSSHTAYLPRRDRAQLVVGGPGVRVNQDSHGKTTVDFSRPATVNVPGTFEKLPLAPFGSAGEDLAKPFDFAVVRYTWVIAAGRDLDTRTALVSVNPSVDGVDVGWSRNTTVYGTSGIYLTWGGDNTSPAGTEAALVYFPKIATDFSLSQIHVRLRANWYDARVSGDITLSFATYLGGSMSRAGTDFINTGGTLQESLSLPRNVVSNISGDVDGDDIGTLIFDTATKTATII